MSQANETRLKHKTKDVVNEKLTQSKDNKAMKEADALRALETLMGKGAIINEDIVARYLCRPNREWLGFVAQGLVWAAESKDMPVEGIDVELFTDYLQWVFANRINYVAGNRNIVLPKSVTYPVIVYDALARISQYDGGKVDGAHYTPSLVLCDCDYDNEADINTAETIFAIDEATQERLWPGQANRPASWLNNDNRVIEFPGAIQLVARLKRAGIMCETALPMHKEMEIRTMFEMEVTDYHITSAGALANVPEIFARVCYTMEPATNLVGAQKLELLRTRDLQSAIYDLAYDYVQGRND